MNTSFGDVVLWVVYFISLYFAVFWLLVFFEFGGEEKKTKKLKNFPFVTIAIPAYNEEGNIADTVESALNLDHPQDKMEIIVINDGSTDRTGEIVNGYAKKNKRLKLITQKNSGKAAAMNNALRISKGEFFVCLDADSVVSRNALRKMLPEFEDPSVGVVLPLMKGRQAKNRLQKVQSIEYLVNIFYKKIMGFINCIHVAPGPFSVYRKSIFKDVGNWDEGNLTEDLEMALRLQKHGYKLVQNMEAEVFTVLPNTIRGYYKQRNRWFKGGVYNAVKYKEMMFNPKYGDFGVIQAPILILSGLLAVTLLLTTFYYALKPHVQYMWHMRLVGFDFWTYIKNLVFDFNILDVRFSNILIFFVMLVVSVFMLYKSHQHTKESLRKQGFINILLFIFTYFLFLGVVWIGIIKDLLARNKGWGTK